MADQQQQYQQQQAAHVKQEAVPQMNGDAAAAQSLVLDKVRRGRRDEAVHALSAVQRGVSGCATWCARVVAWCGCNS
jgi:hypothetical protein